MHDFLRVGVVDRHFADHPSLSQHKNAVTDKEQLFELGRRDNDRGPPLCESSQQRIQA